MLGAWGTRRIFVCIHATYPISSIITTLPKSGGRGPEADKARIAMPEASTPVR